ncbi:DUF1653 domain-containing protein [Clostridium botulinum]|uniref:DUF1653 domain-containing protein n=1 Tax=Clostridium botulinum TaxID=1491 RepID=A0A6B4JRM2_CLOBO|nr:DUF1653 domain-containing protein [Clostridium botulinum]EES50197.1 conserved domain protein [Clostridium botulinum E1 str. 'BoNT E Beluga']MBY6762865.1 DUF1653 domain-containing protein [Clostridium botulinum]MBY6921649.1 DUF1653 domain-containing protein [Clostridium botulinum]MCR1132851.1 DUF1653 domain-containing protein [Clostridium botulinum]NFH70795.1 DUF1653 domain-containing protein [Clostridium botulinum]
MDREVMVGVYKHFKGNNYLVLYIAKHTETMEDMVVYCELYGNRNIWVRPLKMFMSEVDHKKYPLEKQKYRFEFVGNTIRENESEDK